MLPLDTKRSMNGHSKYHVPQSVSNGSSKCGNHAACDVDNQRDGSNIDICSQRNHTENVSKTPTRSQHSNGVWTRCKNQKRNHIQEIAHYCYVKSSAIRGTMQCKQKMLYRCFTQNPCVHPLLSGPRTRSPSWICLAICFGKYPSNHL